MNDPVSRAAFHWWAAECAADPKLPRNLTTGDILAIAAPRVMAVFSGEVRWSETSPGDKAVWTGRPRDIETFKRTYVPPRTGTRLVGENYIEWLNVFDTVEMVPFGENGKRTNFPHCSSFRAFGNMNVGNYALSNMLMAGQLARWFKVSQAYVVVDRRITTDDDISLTMVIGCQPVQAALPLREWVLGVPIGRVIPTRQNFSVTVDAHRKIKTPLELVIHLEGTTSWEVQ